MYKGYDYLLNELRDQIKCDKCGKLSERFYHYYRLDKNKNIVQIICFGCAGDFNEEKISSGKIDDTKLNSL